MPFAASSVDSAYPCSGRCNFFLRIPKATDLLHAVLPDASSRNVDQRVSSSPNTRQSHSPSAQRQLRYQGDQLIYRNGRWGKKKGLEGKGYRQDCICLQQISSHESQVWAWIKKWWINIAQSQFRPWRWTRAGFSYKQLFPWWKGRILVGNRGR